MFCGNCGTKNEDGATFCANCGARLNNLPAGTAPSPMGNQRTAHRRTGGMIAAVIVVLLVILGIVYLVGQLGKNREKDAEELLLGTWLSEYNDMVVFEDDGTCVAPFSYRADWWESADHYTVTKDDTLVLSSEGGHANGTYERVDTEEEALDDMYTYFVSEDTLIIEQDEYTRSK